jgi:cbb3-type cytochrome oxidase subunit 3
MRDQVDYKKVIRWIARVWGTTVMAFVLFFALAHLFGDSHVDDDYILSTSDVLSFVFLISATVLGFAVAWKWEGIGCLITLVSLIGLAIVRVDLFQTLNLISLVVIPALLYGVYWWMNRQSNKTGQL